jgi:dihydrodipicolinate synthase/N-acetylneuraminate lyase
MNIIDMKILKGVFALPPTPLTEDRKIDVEGIRSIIDFEMENGCYGVCVLARKAVRWVTSFDKIRRHKISD